LRFQEKAILGWPALNNHTVDVSITFQVPRLAASMLPLL
jgi:hypothetical protein